MYQIEISEKADMDLENIAKYITLDNPYRSLSFVQGLIDFAKKNLSLFPKTGTEYLWRFFIPYKSYLIFYQIDENKKKVNISRIIHSSQYSAYKYLKK